MRASSSCFSRPCTLAKFNRIVSDRTVVQRRQLRLYEFFLLFFTESIRLIFNLR